MFDIKRAPVGGRYWGHLATVKLLLRLLHFLILADFLKFRPTQCLYFPTVHCALVEVKVALPCLEAMFKNTSRMLGDKDTEDLALFQRYEYPRYGCEYKNG